MKLTLLVLTAGKQAGKKLGIPVSPFLVGRDAECHLRPASPLISKKHCAFHVRDDKVFVEDFGSTNGTVVNGERVKGERELKNKDHIKIGPIEFEVVLEAAALPQPEKKAAVPVAKKPATPVKKPTPVRATAGQGSSATELETTTEVSSTGEETLGTGDSGDDDIAAMLLSLGDDSGSASSTATNEAIPDGSTVMDMPVPAELQEGGEAGDKDKGQKVKEQQQNTSQAARDILSKYMRRPR